MDCCRRLKHLIYLNVCVSQALRLREVVAAYMQRTPCRWLETVSIEGALVVGSHALGPVADVIRCGIATKLKRIEGEGLNKANYEELSAMIEAGLLPNLQGVHLAGDASDFVNRGPWTHKDVLNPFIDRLTQRADCAPLEQLKLMIGLHLGYLPNLKHLHLFEFAEEALQAFIRSQRSEKATDRLGLRGICVEKDISEETVLQLRALFPAATVWAKESLIDLGHSAMGDNRQTGKAAVREETRGEKR